MASRGALRNTEGDNIWNGAIAFGSNTTIGVDADSLTLGGAWATSGGLSADQ